MAREKKGADRKVALIVRNFLKPTQIWILRQANGLSRFKPVFIVKIKTRDTSESNPRIFAMESYSSFISVFNFIGKTFSKNNSWGRALFMNVVLRLNRVRLIHIHFLWNALWLFHLKDKVKVPVVVTAHGSDVNRAFSNPEYKKQIQHIFHKIDAIICVSEFIRQKLLDLGCDRTKLIVNYLGISLRADVQLKREDANYIKLICVAALREEKGHVYLIKALEKVKQRYQNIRLYLVGDGELKAKLVRLVRELDLEDCVEFLGWKTEDEVFEWLAMVDIYVQHSIRYKSEKDWKEEGLPMSLVEAASMGLPLVATDIGGTPEVCFHGYNGLLSEEKDILSMAENIIRLIENPDSRLQFGQMGRKVISEKFDSSRVLPQLENIYQSLINRFNQVKK
jgi:colanic acid/amylovoran biosynthesis glycosyltransferase